MVLNAHYVHSAVSSASARTPALVCLCHVIVRPIIVFIFLIVIVTVHLIVAALVRGRHRTAHLGKVHPRQKRLEKDGHRIALLQCALRVELGNRQRAREHKTKWKSSLELKM